MDRAPIDTPSNYPAMSIEQITEIQANLWV